MRDLAEGAALVLALAALPGAGELLLLTAGALLPRRAARRPDAPGPRRMAVVVPAHDEEAGIAEAIESLLAADRPPCEVDLVVVADNCSDRTAERARAAGSRVLERFDDERRGKGFALGHGFTDALAQGAEVLVVVDADSRVATNLLTEIHAAFARGAQAVQARYEASDEPDAPPQRRLTQLAFFAFNVLRPRGRARLGFSCGLFGNGFAVAAELLRGRTFGAQSIVEDLEYHLELVQRGVRVEFLEHTRVEAPLPQSSQGSRTQRTRWEGGRLRMAAQHLPGLLAGALRRPRLIEPALDLVLLPLGLHVLLVVPALLLGPAHSRTIGAAVVAVFLLHVLTAWALAGAHRADLAALAWAPIYVARKLLLLPATLATARRGASWRRTERDPGA